MIPEHLCISAINLQGYLCLYDKIKGFDAKKSLNAISTSPLEQNVILA